MDPLAVDVREAARLLSVSPYTLRRYIRCGRVPSIRLGRRVLIPVAALQALAQPGSERQDPTQ